MEDHKRGLRVFLWCAIGIVVLYFGLKEGIVDQDIRMPRRLGGIRAEGTAAVITGAVLVLLSGGLFYMARRAYRHEDVEFE